MLSHVNLIAAPCGGDYCLYDNSEKETQGKVVELRFDHKISRQSNLYFPPKFGTQLPGCSVDITCLLEFSVLCLRASWMK